MGAHLSAGPSRRALLAAAGLALPLALGGCLPRRSTAGPMARIVDRAACAMRADTLLVLLPGAYDDPADLVGQGFVQAVRQRRLVLDVWLVDAHLGHYRERSILDRLDADVLAPARAEGYRTIVLAGISIGGFGALLCASTRPDRVSTVVALAPWLGPSELVGEIAGAGGVAPWLAAGGDRRERDGDAAARALWRWLGQAGERRAPELWLGYGRSDRLAEGHRLLAAALPAPQVLAVPGGHDWAPWRALWSATLDGPAFAAVPRCPAA
ncbi:MAG TPA: alpha/beta hydrolase-fold protein [Methylibium sp.]|uniref:alpha/beta hydrolase-fold protein n=1 Tax=Methylibium sp. TaxID=2067992 RepID=UPI002DB942AE|nr:alpha/beta hydrolase-fold protein [Methylibium sp.]HEU4458832.1 alpha/beta hydrolase-fold protein [Methylibium sp.]